MSKHAHNTTPTEAFILNYAGQPVWKAIVDGKVIPAEFNSQGAARAAISVERARRKKQAAAAVLSAQGHS